MARSFSSAVQARIDSDDRLKYFFLIELKFNSTYRFTSLSQDVSWDSQTWTSDGGLFEVDAPRFSSVIDREAYRVVLTDLDEALHAEFQAGVIGKEINVWAGFLDDSNQPLLGADDVVSLYGGYVDSPEVVIDWDTKTASLQGTSPMADLDQVKSIMVSRDGMDQFSSSDTSYDALFEDSEILIKWGKI